MSLNNLSKYFLVSCIIIKIFVSCFGYLKAGSKDLKFSLAFKKEINNDEPDLARRAYNLRNGRGLVKTIENNESVSYKLSSNRPLLNIGLHYMYQNMYCYFSNLKESDINGTSQQVDKSNTYYKTYAILINYITLFFYLLSIPFFMFLAKNIGILNQNLLNVTTGFYLIFPSTLIYMGCIPLYENICLPFSVIGISFLLKLVLKQVKNNSFVFLAMSLMVTMGVLLRPQSLIPTLMVLLVFGLCVLLQTKREGINSNNASWKFIGIFSIVFLISQSFIFSTNYKYFNKFFYTNRADAFMWGHYELAKGSWDGTVDLKGSEGYVYERKIIPGFDAMSEIEQNTAQKNIANNWIKNNFSKEIKLLFKKVAIFFMPYNFDYLKFNFSMFFIHLGFFMFGVFVIVKRRLVFNNKAILFSFAWVIGVVIVNVLFFVEYRIKYFADPYMLIFSIFIGNKIYELFRKNIVKSSIN
jgi:hypothetical protein